MHPFYEKREQKLQINMTENMRFPEHLHEDLEILLVQEGQVEVNVMGKRKILSAGDCAIIFPEMIHSYQMISENRVYILIFDHSFAGSYRRSVQKYCPERPFVMAENLSSDVVLVLERLLTLSWQKNSEFDQSAEAWSALAGAWIHVLLALLMPYLKLEERERSEWMDITGRLVQYIMEHYREQLTLEGLAKELHVNKYYLSHIFSNRLQMNFRQYLNHIRLEHALYEIRATDLPITRIWEEAGFNSQRSFNRIFQETVGITPVEYRKANSNRKQD